MIEKRNVGQIVGAIKPILEKQDSLVLYVRWPDHPQKVIFKQKVFKSSISYDVSYLINKIIEYIFCIKPSRGFFIIGYITDDNRRIRIGFLEYIKEDNNIIISYKNNL